MTVVAIVASGAIGLLVGFGVATVWQRRGRSDEEARTDAPPVPPAIDRLSATLEGLPIGVVITDADGAVVYRNSAVNALAGTHAGVLVDETVERHLERAAAGEATEELLELYGPPKMFFEVRAAPVPGGGAYSFVEDMSERRRIDLVRTDFVANISHELKTPVGALAVLAETLVDDPDPALVRRISERLLDEAHRASRTIDDLLELSRIELGGDPVRDDVDVAEVVRCAVERGEALAEQRSIRITVLDLGFDPRHEPGAPRRPLTVSGDRRQLISAVGNLVENAVKYSEPKGLVQVRTRIEGPWVEFMVADQGVGIPSRDLDRIFERFYRVDKARSRGTGGSGLGLSIVRHVANNHGGEVLVSSLEGEGSTFVLKIPRDGAVPPASASPSTSTPHHPSTPRPPSTPQRGTTS